MKMFAVLSILLMSLIQCGGSVAVYDERTVENAVVASIEMFVPQLVDASIGRGNEQVAYHAWRAISQSIGDVLMPILNGDNPKISDLQSWFDLIKANQVGDDHIRSIQGTINFLFAFIPASKIQAFVNEGVVGSSILNVVRSAFMALKGSIDLVLSRYTEAYSAPRGADEWVPLIPSSRDLRYGFASTVTLPLD